MNHTDNHIITAIKNGDIKVYESMFRQFYAPLCGYANKIVQDKTIAEELVQDVFYILWKKKQSLVIHRSLKSYLYKALYNKCMYYFEHKKVENKYASYLNHSANAAQSQQDAIYRGEMYETYKNILNSLPERSRQVFKLSRNYGLKYDEIAAHLSISVKTVEANMGKALKAFRKGLAAYRS